MKQKAKRAGALALAVLLGVGLLSGCGREDAAVQADPAPAESRPRVPVTDVLSLAWTKAQGTNPYLSRSNLTMQCSQLLFDRLVEIGGDLRTEPSLARSVEVNGNTVTIRMGTGSFEDGAPVTAEDAAASLNAARASAVYGGRFAHVRQVQAQGDTVTVTLSEPDSLFAWLLDIPVLKAAETGLPYPSASGRYRLAEDGEGYYLAAREGFAENTCFPTVRLVEAGSHDAIVAGLSKGTIDLYASELDADLAGSNSCNTVSYNLNDLIFLGVNATAGPLAEPGVRRAISAAIDRRQLADRAYYSRAYLATTLANSRYPFLTGQHTFASVQDAAAVEAALAPLGYTKGEDGWYKDAAGRPLGFELLCYSGSSAKRYAAALIRDQLADCGIQITVVEETDFDLYHEKAVSGQFALYIGEIKLYNNMDMSPFFSPGGDASGGVRAGEALLAAYGAMRADISAHWAFEEAFAAEMPFIPLLYKNGVLTANRRLDGLSPTISDIFYKLEKAAVVPRETGAQ